MKSNKVQREKIINPSTGRFVFTDLPLGKSILESQKNLKADDKKCSFDKHWVESTNVKNKSIKGGNCVCVDIHKVNNPTSNRCVLKTGAIGKQILKEEQVQIETHVDHTIKNINQQGKKCKKQGQIINPVTDRCVKKSGKIGQKILANPVTIKFLDFTFLGNKNNSLLCGCTSFHIVELQRFNKTFILLGEQHTEQASLEFYEPLAPTWITPTYLVKQLFQTNPNIVFDTYLESNDESILYYEKMYKKTRNKSIRATTFLAETQNMLNHKHPFINSRVYSTDIRLKNIHAMNFLIHSLRDIMCSDSEDELSEKCKLLLDNETLIRNEAKDFISSHLVVQSHIDQHMKHLPKDIQTILIQFFQHHINFFERRIDIDVIFQQVKEIVKQGFIYLFQLLTTHNERSKYGFLNPTVFSKMLYNLQALMEWYTMVTILDDTDKIPPAHHIIIYQGQHHITSYMKLLNLMGGTIKMTSFPKQIIYQDINDNIPINAHLTIDLKPLKKMSIN